MTPELSNAIACATALRRQLQSAIATPHTPDQAALSKAIDDFLTRAFRGDTTHPHITPPLKNRSGPLTSHATTPQHPMTFDLIDHLHDQILFSKRTFGPGPRVSGILDHIRKELTEIEKAPHDLEEWIDVVLLAFDGAWRTGASAPMIADALRRKLDKNMAHQWPDWRTAPEGKAIEHVREKPPCAACDRGDFQLGHSEECPHSQNQPLPSGIHLIKDERHRQISKEGWTHQHDDNHTRGELIDASLSYLRAAINPGHPALQKAPPEWPWAKEWWKPSNDPIRNLTKAGALIAAEIDRRQRLKAPHSHAPAPEHTPHSS